MLGKKSFKIALSIFLVVILVNNFKKIVENSLFLGNMCYNNECR